MPYTACLDRGENFEKMVGGIVLSKYNIQANPSQYQTFSHRASVQFCQQRFQGSLWGTRRLDFASEATYDVSDLVGDELHDLDHRYSVPAIDLNIDHSASSNHVLQLEYSPTASSHSIGIVQKWIDDCSSSGKLTQCGTHNIKVDSTPIIQIVAKFFPITSILKRNHINRRSMDYGRHEVEWISSKEAQRIPTNRCAPYRAFQTSDRWSQERSAMSLNFSSRPLRKSQVA